MTRRLRGEDGFAAAELALGIGVLVFPVAALVLTLPGWSERQATARAIAREVARGTAASGSCDPSKAARSGREMADGLGLATGALAVSLDCRSGARLPRGGTVTARVTVEMPVEIPGIGAVEGWRWTAVHAEPVDPYRSLP